LSHSFFTAFFLVRWRAPGALHSHQDNLWYTRGSSNSRRSPYIKMPASLKVYQMTGPRRIFAMGAFHPSYHMVTRPPRLLSPTIPVKGLKKLAHLRMTSIFTRRHRLLPLHASSPAHHLHLSPHPMKARHHLLMLIRYLQQFLHQCPLYLDDPSGTRTHVRSQWPRQTQYKVRRPSVVGQVYVLLHTLRTTIYR